MEGRGGGREGEVRGYVGTRGFSREKIETSKTLRELSIFSRFILISSSISFIF